MRMKSGISVQGLKPEMLIALMVAEETYTFHGYSMVLTSGTEGKHSKASRHYIGMAIDLRTRYFGSPAEKRLILKDLREALGSEFVVVSHKTHFHIQFNGTAK